MDCDCVEEPNIDSKDDDAVDDDDGGGRGGRGAAFDEAEGLTLV